MSVQGLIETSFNIESIFLAGEVFILGFYISEWEKGANTNKLKSLLNILLALIIPAFLLISLDLILLSAFDLDFLTKTVYTLFSILLAIPNLAIIMLILKRKP